MCKVVIVSGCICKRTSLSRNEENIVPYAAGYVPMIMVLMRRHETSSSKKSVVFVESLSSMAVNGKDSTLLEYTTNCNWISTIKVLFRILVQIKMSHVYLIGQSTALIAMGIKEKI